MFELRVRFLVVFGLSYFICLATHAQQTIQLFKYQADLLQLVNSQRQKGCKCGSRQFPPTSPLKWNKQLENASLLQVNYLSNQKILTHRGQDGFDVRSRLAKANYQWQSYAENIAEGYDSPQEVFKAWMESPGHCKNIMGNYKEMAAVKKGDYWVQDFGSPKVSSN